MSNRCPICFGPLHKSSDEKRNDFECKNFTYSHFFCKRLVNDDIIIIKCRVDDYTAIIDYKKNKSLLYNNYYHYMMNSCIDFDFSDPESFKNKINQNINVTLSVPIL